MITQNNIEYLPASKLKASAANPRTHSTRQIAQLEKSMKQFGFTVPLVVDEDNVVLAGHGRLLAALNLGIESLPCVRLASLTAAAKRAYLIADNKLAANSGWNFEMLAAEFDLIVGAGFELDLTGFDQGEADAIIQAAQDASVEGGDDDEEPEQEVGVGVSISRLNDHWQLGRHELVCADAKDPAAFDVLMHDEVADGVFTDPPYNVKIDKNVCGLGRVRHREFAEASGEMSPDQFQAFLKNAFENIERACRNGAIVFTCMDWRHLGECLAAGYAVFTELKNICIWSKKNAGMGTFYRSQHEEVLVWKVGDAPHTNNFELGGKGRYRTNVWNYAGVNSFKAERMDELKLHPTVKPVALVADAIRDVTNRGDIVLDPFAGSGTTLIAAEKTGRIARVMEIDPIYCDGIIRRWERLTGRSATLVSTSQTFEEVSLKRSAEQVVELGEGA